MAGALEPLAARLQQIQWGFAAARVLTIANRTGLLRHLAIHGAATAADAAAALGLDPEATGKVMRALCAHGILDCAAAGFSLPEPLRPWLAAGPEDGLGAALEHGHELYDRWGSQLEGWLRTGETPPRVRTPEQITGFVTAMKGLTEHRAPALAAAIGLDGVGRMLDLGGARATYAIAFCRLSPDLRATVSDIPEVCELATSDIAAAGLAHRIDTLPGDYHEVELGTGYDLVLLSNILHSERPGGARSLLTRAASTLNPGGRLAIVEFRIDEAKCQHPFGTLFAINMRSFGDTYSEPELRSFLGEAGLTGIERQDLDENRWLITARR